MPLQSPWVGWEGSKGERLGLKASAPSAGRRSHTWRQRSDGPTTDDVTVNIGVVTSDAVVLGCDSVASTSSYYIDPIRLDWHKGADGNWLKDADGKFSLKFDFDDYETIVTNAWGGVTKLFPLHESPSPVAAVTAGLAKLKDRPIASWASEFHAKCAKRNKRLVSVETICQKFLEFMRAKYDEHYADSRAPERFREGPEFLVGGYGRNDDFPSLFRIRVKENTVVRELGGTSVKTRSGVAWNGQSDAVERFIRGYDGQVKWFVEKQIAEGLGEHSDKITTYITDTVNKLFDQIKQKVPEGTEIKLPDLAAIKIDWEQFAVDVDYANLPLQEAVNLVSFLVLLQDGKSRFARGVPTVGGRTHLGVITKEKGLRLLNEPELAHQYTGFADDR